MMSLQLSGPARPPQGSSEAAGSELSMSTEVVLLHQQVMGKIFESCKCF